MKVSVRRQSRAGGDEDQTLGGVEGSVAQTPPGTTSDLFFREVAAHSDPKGHYSSASSRMNKADYTCGIITKRTKEN